MTRSPHPQPKILLYAAIALAGMIIIGGSIWVITSSGTAGRQLVYQFTQFTARLFSAGFVVKLDRTILPADGHAQTLITVTAPRGRRAVTASIIQGDGQILRTPTDSEPYQFTYTASTSPGEVSILFKAGTAEQTVRLTLAPATIPATPVLTAPPDGSTLTAPKPEVVGTGLPNIQIVITDNGHPNTTTRTDANGQFRIHLDEPLYNGQHTLSAIAVSDLGIESPPSNLITVTVTTEPVKLDTNNIRLYPTRIPVNSSFAVFVPASLNTAKVTAEFEGRTIELFDYNGSSVFVGTLPTPAQPGTYSITLVLTDEAGNTSRFDRLVRVTVVSG